MTASDAPSAATDVNQIKHEDTPYSARLFDGVSYRIASCASCSWFGLVTLTIEWSGYFVWPFNRQTNGVMELAVAPKPTLTLSLREKGNHMKNN